MAQSNKNNVKLSKALDIACRWVAHSGACSHYPGYICYKDFTKDGVCAACLRRHFLKLAREEMKND